ncbi:hypothetical protein DSM25559_5466 [Agrobacterium rosae]|uniref:Uncharacterized protein n=2 Tax=Agrobacterium rosae TaxID=1972867 RepID=A0A1R3U3R7_9HYPH|nr:hypothetical protein DSM25559_5466 [Agrobacterium rosae]
MRRGIDGLSALVEGVIRQAPGSGAIFGSAAGARPIKLFGGTARGFACFTRFWNADTSHGRRPKMALCI